MNKLPGMRAFSIIQNQKILSVKDFGAVGDGAYDDSQAFIDAINFACDNHMTIASEFGKTYIVDNIVISNKNNFRLAFYGTLKRKDNLPSTNPATSTLTFSNCSDFIIDQINFDGNHLNNNCAVGGDYDNEYLQEHRHCLVLIDCKYVKIGKIYGKNPSGDVLAIYGPSTYSLEIRSIDGISIDNGGNLIALGRNTVSVMNGKNIYFGVVKSQGVGHVTMPGGFDIEPNNGESVDGVYVDYMYIISSAMSALGITTKYGNGNNIKNIMIGHVYIENDVLDEKRLLIVAGATNVYIEHCYIKGTSSSHALHVGIAGTAQPVYNLNITYAEIDTCKYGLIADKLDGGNINIKVKNNYENFLRLYSIANFNFEIKGYFSSSIQYPNAPVKNFCIFLYLSSLNTVSNCKFSGDLYKPNIRNGERAITTNASSSNQIANCIFENLNLDGWTDTTRIVGNLSHVRQVNISRGRSSGATAERPSGIPVNFQYFDTTLIKPIWWGGTTWVDATGTTV